MECFISSSDLLPALQLMRRCTDGHEHTVRMDLLSRSATFTTFTAYDPRHGIVVRKTIPVVKVIDEGSVYFDGLMAQKFLSRWEYRVNVHVSAPRCYNWSTWSIGYDSKILTLPDTPRFDPGNDDSPPGCYLQIPAKIFRDAMRRVLFAAAKVNRHHRFTLVDVYWETEGSHLTLVATDGIRMAKATATVTMPMPMEDLQSFRVHKNAMRLVQFALREGFVDSDKKSDDLVRFWLSPQGVRIVVRDTIISARLSPGDFPPYREVERPASQTPKGVVRILVWQLREAVESAIQVFGTRESAELWLSTKTDDLPKGKVLAVKTCGESGVSFKEVLTSLRSSDGDPFGVCLDGRLVRQMLCRLSEEEYVDVEYHGEGYPVAFVTQQSRYIQMPLSK